MQRIVAGNAGYKVWSANLTVNTRGLALSKQFIRDDFASAKVPVIVSKSALETEL